MDNVLKGSLCFKGERGYSAYELAVKNGFVGTEKEWLAQLITNNTTTKHHNAVSNMKLDKALLVGSQVQTFGYYEANDGGAATYLIREKTDGDVEDRGSIHFIGDNLVAQLIIQNKAVNPMQFGAYGYNGEYNASIPDSTEQLRTMMAFAQNNDIKKIILLGHNYNCKGDNCLGLKKESTNNYFSLDIDGQNSTFYWDSEGNEKNAFSFVGYLRYSKWFGFTINCLNTSYKGDIFTTHFGIENQNHYFSSNIFENIFINKWWDQGSCNNVIDFRNDGVSTHDDLSTFDKVWAKDYINFFYTNNNESVSNVFNNCNTTTRKDNTVDFNIDCAAWSGHLTINNHHFTLIADDCTLVKTAKEANETHYPISLNDCRLEARTSRFLFCDLGSHDLYINSLRPLSSYTKDDTTQYFKVGAEASLILNRCVGLPPYIQIGTSTTKKRGNLIAENCSFNNNTVNTPMPVIKFGEYENYREMSQESSPVFFNNIMIKDGISSSRSEWFKNYELSSYGYVKHKGIHKILKETNKGIIVPVGNIVIEDLIVKHPTANKCRVQITNYQGNGSVVKDKLFTDGKATVTDTQKIVLPQLLQNAISITLYDSNGNTIDNSGCVLELDYRPIFHDDEINQTTNSMISKGE
jgi:hypothetical protein